MTDSVYNALPARLPPLFPDRMAIVDCETTGGKAVRERIIEVAVLIVLDGEIVERFHSLIQPQKSLPIGITRLTGITQEMLADAPTFDEIAATLFQKLNGRVLVAHNARFDYSFLKNEFKRSGYDYSAKTLCTVKLSRAAFPHYPRHGLDHIIQRLHLILPQRHRAMDDALVLWHFLSHVTQRLEHDDIQALLKRLLKTPSLPPHLPPEDIQRLPESPGVYFFYNESGRLLYVGKSINLKERVMSHFTQDHASATDLEISQQITHIDFEPTLTDFSAQIKENQYIKALSPALNRRQKKAEKLYQLMMQTNLEGYLELSIQSVQTSMLEGSEEATGLFRGKRMAQKKLEKMVKEFMLCEPLCGLESARTKGPCFGFQLKKCLGACCAKEPYNSYNQRVTLAMSQYRKKVWPWSGPVLIQETQTPFESSLETPLQRYHLLDQWLYLGELRDESEVHELLSRPMTVEQWLDERDARSVHFDLDTYHILVRFLLQKAQRTKHGLKVLPLPLRLNSHEQDPPE